ncbi:unnamed protein product [Menidia menidia]|uniref:(Atlantic silverside) hypothetical protein n=1 Tax=Menidia menidia TaxID=238744 RepID=A0A8S4BT49_9TELE|nr:unnamed protein product [Menidia menidia]
MKMINEPQTDLSVIVTSERVFSLPVSSECCLSRPQSLYASVSSSLWVMDSDMGTGHIDGVQLVCQEGVPQMHPLLLPPGVDGDHPRVYDDHHPHDEVVFLQDHIGDERHQVQGLLLRAAELCHHHQQVGPCKHGTVGARGVTLVADVRHRVPSAFQEPHLSAMLRWARDTDVSMSMG